MIRFASPLFLIAIPAIGLLLWFLFPRHRNQFVLRFISVAALIVALSEPEIAMREAQDVAVFLVDRSASVRRTVDDIEIDQQIRGIIAEHPDWAFGVVTFAENARALTPTGEPFAGLPVEYRGDVGSRFDKAIDLGLAMMPPNGANRLVLISDGALQDTTIAGITAAQMAGVPVSVLPIGVTASSDAVLRSLDAPNEVHLSQPFDLRIGVTTQRPTLASLAVYRNDELLSYGEITLSGGSSAYEYRDVIDADAFSEYTAVVKSPEDLFPENDARSVLVQTLDTPSVLLIDPTQGDAIPALLDAGGIRYATQTSVPQLTTLSKYKQVILAGLPLTDLTASATTAIEQFVENLGGGLLVIQGEKEVRGFGGGPIDELLPVSFTTPEKERDPGLAVVYVLDRSSSMGELVGLKAKIRILREAAAASIFLLPPDTLVGLVGFDDDYDWLLPMGPVGDATAVYSSLQALAAGGGTSMYAPLSASIDELIETVARVKHILVVSDGKTADKESDYPGLLAKLGEYDDITLSAIALGETPNLELLGTLVEVGRGELYHVVDFLSLPQATMQITQRLGRSRFVTGEATVEGPLLSRIDNGAVPPLSGYVLTYPRSPSSVLLEANGDPIAATWRTGLGSVTILNVDLAGRWSAEWLAWPPLGSLFEELLATTEPVIPASAGLFPSVLLERTTATLLVDARTSSGGFADFLSMDAKLLPGEADLTLKQVAPGVYRVRFPVPEEGGYALNIFDRTSGRSAQYSFSVPYAAEYGAIGRNDAVLERIAEATGGAVLPDGSLEEAVRKVRAVAARPLFPVFLIVALALFILDVALRKSRFRKLPLPRVAGFARRAADSDQQAPPAN